MSPRDRIALLTCVITATLSATATADWMAEAPREEIKPITSKLDNGHLLIAADDREGLNGGGFVMMIGSGIWMCRMHFSPELSGWKR